MLTDRRTDDGRTDAGRRSHWYTNIKYLKDIQLIFIASYRMTNEPRHVISNNVAF